MAIEIEKKYKIDKKMIVELTAKLGELGENLPTKPLKRIISIAAAFLTAEPPP